MAPQVVVENIHVLPFASMALYFSTTVLCYIIALVMDHVEPVFPFISHVVAYPPQSGLAVVLAVPAAVLGILSLIVRYIVTDHRRRVAKSDNSDTIKSLSKKALYCGIVANISILFVLMNPVGFPWPERFDMVMAIGIPHHVGDFAALIGFTAYIFIEMYLTYSLRSIYKGNTFVQFALVVGASIGIIGILATVYPALTEIFHTLVDERNGSVHFTYKKYSFTAATCAVSEWLFVGMCLAFVATFYKDFKDVKIKFHLKSKEQKQCT